MYEQTILFVKTAKNPLQYNKRWMQTIHNFPKSSKTANHNRTNLQQNQTTTPSSTSQIR